MKTDELINLLKEDAPSPARVGRLLPRFLLAGAVFSALLLLATVGLRPDMAAMIFTPRVAFKIVETAALAAVAVALVLPAGRPETDLGRSLWLLLLPLALLAGAVLLEARITPQADWKARWIGAHAGFCLFFIPALSAAPLAALLWALRTGAPARPGLAGAVAGLSAGSMAAALYAWHCPDDSPFFVASWYMLAIGAVTLVGYATGRRLLRW